MRRRTLLTNLGASASALAVATATVSGSTGGKSDIDVEDAKKELYRASKKDKQAALRAGQDVTSARKSNENVNAVLADLPQDVKVKVADEHLSVSTELQEPSIARSTAQGRSEIQGSCYIYYDWPHTDTPVAYWYESIEWEYDGDNITEVNERYWSDITTTGQIDQWERKDQEVRSERGGVGESRYRLFTAATFAMCFGIGPIQQCFNQTELWVDMEVEADGQYDVDTKADVGTDPE